MKQNIFSIKCRQENLFDFPLRGFSQLVILVGFLFLSVKSSGQGFLENISLGFHAKPVYNFTINEKELVKDLQKTKPFILSPAITVQYKLNENLALETGLWYQITKIRMKHIPERGIDYMSVHSDVYGYNSFPLVLNYTFNPASKVKYKAYAGTTYMSSFLDDHTKFIYTLKESEADYHLYKISDHLTFSFKTFSLTGGMGLSTKLGNKSEFSMNAFVHKGFKEVSRIDFYLHEIDSGVEYINDTSIKNKADMIGLNFSYYIALKQKKTANEDLN